jgi:hypothetical protein
VIVEVSRNVRFKSAGDENEPLCMIVMKDVQRCVFAIDRILIL